MAWTETTLPSPHMACIVKTSFLKHCNEKYYEDIRVIMMYLFFVRHKNPVIA